MAADIKFELSLLFFAGFRIVTLDFQPSKKISMRKHDYDKR